eukprot:6413124-Amphidinium_carterae.1
MFYFETNYFVCTHAGALFRTPTAQKSSETKSLSLCVFFHLKVTTWRRFHAFCIVSCTRYIRECYMHALHPCRDEAPEGKSRQQKEKHQHACELHHKQQKEKHHACMCFLACVHVMSNVTYARVAPAKGEATTCMSIVCI